MKSNQLSTPAAPDWTRAKGLLADLKSAVRRSLSAQVLLGKELSSLKRKLGYLGKGTNRGPEGQFVATVKTWDQWCQSELGVVDRTADRWIQCFLAALKRAKARKSKEPEACRLLEIPAAELTGDELESLAKHVDRLVDRDTQAGLLEELGIVKDTKLPGGDTSAFRKTPGLLPLDLMAIRLFADIPRLLDKARKEIFQTRTHADYRMLLQELPLASDNAESPCLLGIQRMLEETLNGDLAQVLKDVDQAVQRKMHGTPPKRVRKKTTATSRK